MCYWPSVLVTALVVAEAPLKTKAQLAAGAAEIVVGNVRAIYSYTFSVHDVEKAAISHL